MILKKSTARLLKNIITIDKIQILTADCKIMQCKTIVIHLETEQIDSDLVIKTAQWWTHWMGHIYFSRDILNAKSSYEGAVRLAANRELEKHNVKITRLHIAKVELIT